MAKAEPRSITRRSMLAAFALPVIPALPAIAAPPLPVAAPDPVHAAIKAHIHAYRTFIAVLDALAVAETEAWHAPRGQRRAAKKRLKEAYAAERRFGDAESNAFERLLATVPQTLHGAAAVLTHVRRQFERGDMCDEDETITLLGSIECVVCRAAGLPQPKRPAFPEG